MFASQLLRILQALPPSVDHDTCMKADSAFDIAKLEAIMKENRLGALCDINNRENDAVRLASDIRDKDRYFNTPELECAMIVEDFTNCNNCNKNDDRGYLAPCIISSSKMELLEMENEDRDRNEFRNSVAICTTSPRKMELSEDTDLYTDKNVTECELPELIVCYKENTYNVVKDICIDEGVVSKDKILIECGNDKGLCTILPPDGKKNGGMTEEEEIELVSRNGSKYSSENGYQENDSCERGTGVKILTECENDKDICTILPSTGNKNGVIKKEEEMELLSVKGSKSSSENGYQEDDSCERGIGEKVETELLIPDSVISSAEGDFDNDSGDDGGSVVPVQTGEEICNATNRVVDDVSREEIVTNSMPSFRKFGEQISLESLFRSPDDGNEAEESAQIPYSKPLCESSSVVSAPEESNKTKPVNKLSYNSKVESGTITFDFNSSKSEASDKDNSLADTYHEQPLKIHTEARHEDEISGDLASAGEVQHGQGESSFSMAAPVSGLITYSGPISYSGSISLRSDSSTTSTRSFAFPILQSEWNSSPIRMAKADRRHFRRHRGWRHGFLCCRF